MTDDYGYPSSEMDKCCNWLNNVWNLSMRKKQYKGDIYKTPLKRCLDTLEICMFGVSQMVGAGIFVLTGTLIVDIAGPACVLSYVLAGISSFLTALCYAELATRIPKAGSCFTYTYFALGELFAFLIGWMVLLDNVIGMAAIAKAFSATINALTGRAISNWTISVTGGPWEVQPFAPYPDFVALGLVILAMLITASGAKVNLNVNMVITFVLIVLLTVIIICGYIYCDPINWSEQMGGFMPFGFSGVLSGASICVFAFSGFDLMSNTSEEAKNPRKSIPVAMMAALIIVTVLYLNASLSLSLLVPRFEVNTDAPFAYAFQSIGQYWLFIFSAIATLVATGASKVADMYVIPRLMYALASDGFLCSCFAHIWSVTQVPLISLIVSGFVVGILAMFISLTVLADMCSVGLLISYIMVGVNVCLIRYNGYEVEMKAILDDDEPQNVQDENSEGEKQKFNFDTEKAEADSGITKDVEADNVNLFEEERTDYPQLKSSCQVTRRLVQKADLTERQAFGISFGIFFACSIALAVLLVYGLTADIPTLWWCILTFMIPVVLIVIILSIIVITSFKPKSNPLVYEVPYMPLVPLLTVSFNILLFMTMEPESWIRFAVCTLAGMVIYYCYGIHNTHPYQADYDELPSDGHSGEAPAKNAEEDSETKKLF